MFKLTPSLSILRHVIVVACILVSGPAWPDAPDKSDQEPTPIRGVVKPLGEAVLATEIVARILSMPFEDGNAFNKGDVLVRFDCARFHTELTVSEANLAKAQLVYDSNVELAQHAAIGTHEVKQAKAEVDAVRAQVNARKIVVDHCLLRAPYAGRVVNTLVNEFETPAQGGPLIKVINDSDFELELLVPSAWLSWLRNGARFTFLVDETGETHAAELTQIGATVDPVSQTIMIKGRFDKRPDWVLAGMSGTANFNRLAVSSVIDGA